MSPIIFGLGVIWGGYGINECFGFGASMIFAGLLLMALGACMHFEAKS